MNSGELPADDIIRPFQLDRLGLRGRLVRLGPTADEILRRHGYPDPVCHMLGQALSLSALLAGALKFDGVFTLQTKGDGPIPLLVSDFMSPGKIRGYAQFDAEAIATIVAEAEAEDGAVSASVPNLLGSGYAAFTVDQGEDTERYQGIVELAGDTLADCAHKYFRESEQIDTAIRLASGQVKDDSGALAWRSGGLMIQRLPEGDPGLMARGVEFERDEDSEENWRRAIALLASVKDDELLAGTLGPDELLYRLYHDEGVRVFEPVPLAFGCRCSRQRAETVLRAMAEAELRDLSIDGMLDVTCEFCNSKYDFELADFLQ